MFASHEVELSAELCQGPGEAGCAGRRGVAEWPVGAGVRRGPGRSDPGRALGAVLGASKLVRVQLLEPVPREDTVVLPLRWEATGAAGRLFPVLDANLVLTPSGEDRCKLVLTGAYRPPLGGVGAALDRTLLNRAAAATLRSLVSQVADSITAGQQAPGHASAQEHAEPAPARWQAEPEAST